MLKFTRLLALSFVVAVATLAAPRLSHADALQSNLPAPSAESAVRQAVEADGNSYAGDCVSTVSPGDVGKVCSRMVAEQAGARAYMVGRTFSEFSGWVFVARDGDGWVVSGAAPLDFTATDIPWP